VEVVRLSCTPDHRDGEWLRIRYFGFHVADVRSVAELERWFPLVTPLNDLDRSCSLIFPTGGGG
jgi:hypothetical protein